MEEMVFDESVDPIPISYFDLTLCQVLDPVEARVAEVCSNSLAVGVQILMLPLRDGLFVSKCISAQKLVHDLDALMGHGSMSVLSMDPKRHRHTCTPWIREEIAKRQVK